MESFLMVAGQVLVLFFLIAVGFILGKTKVMGEGGAKICADIALLIATPCAVINSFRRDATAENLLGLAVALLCSLSIHVVGIVVGRLLYRGNRPDKDVYQLAVVMSNAGFMALPLQQAILGDIGVFYGATYVVIFNVILWSYGQMVMTGGKEKLSAKKILINPGSIGLVLGFLVMLLPVDLPMVIAAPLTHLANLNTPLPMLFIGYYLSKTDLKAALKQSACLGACAVRLVLIPVICAVLLYAVGVRDALLISMVIAGSAPIAAGVPMFTSRYGRNTDIAVNMVSVSTLLSVITMPVLVALVQQWG